MDVRTYQFFDKLFKFIIGNNLSSFFLFFGINCLPLLPISNEIVDEGLNKSLMDYPVISLNGIVNIEFQFKTTKKDIFRFLRYAIHLYEKYALYVYTVVIDFRIRNDKAKSFRLNSRDELTIYFKSLIERNPDIILNNIRYKIENKIRLTGVDIVGLELLPLLDPKRKIELLREAADILLLLNDDLLSIEKIKEIRDVLLNYCVYWGDDETLFKLGSVSEMDEKFCEDAIKRYGELVREKTMKEGIKEGRIEGIKEGRKEGRMEGRKEGIKKGIKKGRMEGIKEGMNKLSYEIANDLIKEGYAAKDVSRISRLDISIVNKLILMK